MGCQVQHGRDPMGSGAAPLVPILITVNEGCHPTASLQKEILQLEEAGLEKSLHAGCLHCIETEAPTTAPSPFLQHVCVETPMVCVCFANRCARGSACSGGEEGGGGGS